MTYDDTAYLLIITVANTPEGLAISGISVAELVPPTWVEGTDDEPGYWTGGTWDNEKEPNYTPGEYIPGEPGEPGTWVSPLSGIRFVNEFSRDIVETFDNPALAFSKTIVGELANLTLDFDFSATLTVPQSAIDRGFEGPVVARIVEADGTLGATVTFTGTLPVLSADFTLGHGETLAFDRLPAGTTFTVTEDAVEHYSAGAVITVGGAVVHTYGTPGVVNGPLVNTALTTGTYVVSDARDSEGALLGNSAGFTNTHHANIITGLDLVSMPFVLALAFATVVLALMMASRSRRRIEALPIAH
jgi:hypothetical protein